MATFPEKKNAVLLELSSGCVSGFEMLAPFFLVGRASFKVSSFYGPTGLPFGRQNGCQPKKGGSEGLRSPGKY